MGFISHWGRRIGGMGRVGAIAIILALVACTAGPMQNPSSSGARKDFAAVEAGDAMLIDAPESLLNLSELDLKNAMGEPQFVWVEADAEMWRYDSQACALFVYLYPEGVRHVDIQSDGLDDAERAACFRDLVDGHT